jgi:hypothetical protein
MYISTVQYIYMYLTKERERNKYMYVCIYKIYMYSIYNIQHCIYSSVQHIVPETGRAKLLFLFIYFTA